MRSAFAFSVDNKNLLPDDAVFLTDSFYGPVYGLASGLRVIVDPNDAVNFPGLPAVTSRTTVLLGEDGIGNPVYGITAGGIRLTDVVAAPTYHGASLTPVTQDDVLVVPAGYRLAGYDPEIGTGDGRPAAIFVDTADPTRFFIPGIDPLPAGAATSTQPYPAVQPAPVPVLPPGSGPSLGEGQEIWLAPVDPFTRQSLLTGGGIDFNDLISAHSSWPGIGANVGVFSVYAYFFLAAPDQEIKELLAFVARNGLKLAVQAGAVSVRADGLGSDTEGFIYGDELHTVATRIQALGGTADYLAMDEPDAFATAIGYPIQDAVRSAVDNVQQFLNIFPNAKVGDQEPIGGHVSAAMYAQFIALWHSYAGRSLDFVQIDVDWNSPTWQADMAAIEAVARADGQSITTIFNGRPQDMSSAAWTADALANAIAVSSDPTLRPDAAVFQSFESAPSLIGSPMTPDSLGGVLGGYLATPYTVGPATAAAPAVSASITPPQWTVSFDAEGVMRSRSMVAADGSTTTVTYDSRGFADQVTRAASGAITGAQTNEPDFDVNYYLKTYGAVLPAGADPLVYFETTGWRLGQNPSVTFDTGHYLRAVGGTVDGNPLQDYEARGLLPGVSPSALFDPTFYANAYPTVVAASVDLFQHFLTFGYTELRDPDPLLSIAFYNTQKGAGSASPDPLIDYVQSGWKLGLDPSPLFDTDYYLSLYPDVAQSGMDPLTEYLDEGWKLGRSPTPWFDPAYYLAHNPDVAAAGVDPLVHFLEVGAKEGRDPSATFSVSAYLQTYPAIAANGINPLVHYVEYGQYEGYVAFPAVDHVTTGSVTWRIDGTYGGQSTDSDEPMQPFSGVVLSDPVTGLVGSVLISLLDTGGNPTDANGVLSGALLTKTGVGAYTVQGTAAALTQAIRSLVFAPAPLAAGLRTETDFTIALQGGSSGSDAGTSVIAIAPPAPPVPVATGGVPPVDVSASPPPPVVAPPAPQNADPQGMFDPAYYLAHNPDVAAAHFDPLAHYEMYGWHEGRDPNAYFDTTYYLDQNPDVAASGFDPLLHFELYGWHEGRQPSLLFDDAKYLSAYPDVANAGIDPLAHYIEFGQHESRATFLTGGTAPADPLVDTVFYDRQLGATLIPSGVAGAQQAAWSYDTTGWQKGLNPDAWFDTSYYLSHNPDVAAAHVDPLVHYETYGWKEGRDPSAQFSTNKYLAANPDVKNAGFDPLLHYVEYGQNEHRAIFAV